MTTRLSDLLAKKAELERQILEMQREERTSAIAQVKALMAQHGLSLADLGTRSASGPASKARPSAKVPAKFRDAATGQSWSGRGLQPTWLKQALAGGAKLEQFRV